ncbi:hypothetical protein CAC42_6466 [Sphaceloma murrayae]|uniref:Amidase domain-containing protein n=1 Tax=Sphaceloma murrayae TaxID=2082308 RepID=A0A2K1QN66_9PEZI|nr:hypothetical protein CAC42_6466 [Sphaceloma murrayae]
MYSNLDEISAPEPVQNPDDSSDTANEARTSQTTHQRDAGYENLDELADPAPDQNPEEDRNYRHSNLEDEREKEEYENSNGQSSGTDIPTGSEQSIAESLAGEKVIASERFVRFTVWSYLVLFSILGTLARLGLQGLTRYPGAPIPNTELWANVGGSFVMGFIREDRLLFRKHWASANTPRESRGALREKKKSMGSDQQGITESFMAAKATIPAYVGVTVGFCGSFTSFSSFIRDVFLALSNDLNTASISSMTMTSVPRVRSDGYSVMAVLGVLIVEITVSLGALSCGAHMATFLHPFADSASSIDLEKHLDGLAIVFGWGAWIGAIIMAVLPPDRSNSSKETWRSQANCLSEINFVSAREHARNLDAYWRLHGRVSGPLHGLPISVMDRYNIAGLESACGFISWLGSPKKKEDEGTIVQKLRHLGAVVFCKTNVPMSMMLGETTNNIVGSTINPYNRISSAGGACGGEGTLIALRGSPLGLTTDMGKTKWTSLSLSAIADREQLDQLASPLHFVDCMG